MTAETAISRASVERLLRPKSIAIVGVSAEPGSMGGRALANLDHFGFKGAVHLVSRGAAMIGDRASVASIDNLPDGIDAAVVAVPAKAVLAAVQACASRGIKGLVIFAAGFAEAGAAGRVEQEKIAAAAHAADIALLGPNTLGFTNYVDNIPLAFGPNHPSPVAGRPALAVIAQSGAMMGSVRMNATARRLAVSYTIATGNEAVTSVEDYLAFLVDEPHTSAIAIYAEQLRQPRRFLELAAAARKNGKPIILLHPGRSQKARDAAASHTGALSGDYDTMRALLGHEAVVVIDTLEEFFDAAELLTRSPSPPIAGPAILTDSGAFCGLSHDLCDHLDLSLPALSPETTRALAARLPDFASSTNPLDITAQGLKDMGLYANTADILLKDAACGSILVATMPSTPPVGLAKAEAMLPVLTASDKPAVYVVLGGAAPVDPRIEPMFLDKSIPFFRSPERALRAIGHVTRYAHQMIASDRARRPSDQPVGAVLSPPGVWPEYRGKSLLKEAGIAAPEGALAQSASEAAEIAARIGFPVVLKVQSAALPHKTEVGGVIVGIRDEGALRAAWDNLERRVAVARPGLGLDGMLVEAMAAGGVEMMVGGRRDRDWGPLLLFGLGGIWIEVTRDVRLVPADMGRASLLEEIGRLKSRVVLQGYRGAEPVDIEAFADVIGRIGALLLHHPEIAEIDVNPLVLYSVGRPPLALDALVTIGARPAHGSQLIAGISSKGSILGAVRLHH